jgi:catechol 2,3-dioxygenase-like lactoylglutathione lyase family enzyme
MIRGGFVRLQTSDLDRALRFYIETLGMKLVEQAAGAAVLDAGDGFHLRLEAGAGGAPTAITFLVKVPLAEATSIYENRGVVFDAGARFRDPDGNLLELASPRDREGDLGK